MLAWLRPPICRSSDLPTVLLARRTTASNLVLPPDVGVIIPLEDEAGVSTTTTPERLVDAVIVVGEAWLSSDEGEGERQANSAGAQCLDIGSRS